LELVKIGGGFTELPEVFFKDIGHPVPAGTHIEGKALLLEIAGPAAGPVVFFQHQHLEALLCQAGGSGNAGKTGAKHHYFLWIIHARKGT
jgi:hypothetical protein